MPRCDLHVADIAQAVVPSGMAACVYADPPYGTGRRFEADYHDGLSHDPLETTVRVAYDALAEGGFFWLHLDDRRAFAARSVGDAVFGPQGFVTTVVWQRSTSPSQHPVNISRTHDILLLYVKGAGRLHGRPRGEEPATLFATPDDDSRPWRRDVLATSGSLGYERYAIMNPMTGRLAWPGEAHHWRWSKTKILALLLEWCPEYHVDISGNLVTHADCLHAPARQEIHPWPLLYFGNAGTSKPQIKSYRSATIPWTTWWPASEVGSTSDAARESKAIAGRAFSTPKPEALIRRILEISSSPGDTVVELYAGSGPMTRVGTRLGRHVIAVENNERTARDYILAALEPDVVVSVHPSEDGGLLQPPPGPQC